MNALILLFYRIAALFTRVPKKTRHEHTKLFGHILPTKDILQGKYINNQGAFFDLPYGEGNVGLNGCGPIAVYNSLVALSEIDMVSGDKSLLYSTFLEVLSYFEKNGATMKGRFGTSPLAIKKFFKKKGFDIGFFKKKTINKLNDFSENYSAFISIVFNDSKNIGRGLHFICTKKNEDGTFTSHNPEFIGNSLFETLNKCSYSEIRHVYTIGIKKRSAN